MKIAVSGKGGTGKTTVAGLLAHWFRNDGFKVLAVDADPDANLASAIGIPSEQAASIIPISKQRELIQERTGARGGQFGQLFKLNPTVNDIPDKYCVTFRGIKVLVMGGIQKGGGGCACPENVLIRRLLSEIVLSRNEAVVVDMEAGIEHLGRATAGAIDKMLITVEPGSRSTQTAQAVIRLSKDIGIPSFGIIANKIQSGEQLHWIRDQFPEKQLLGTLSYNEKIRDADLMRKPLIDNLDDRLRQEMTALYTKIRES